VYNYLQGMLGLYRADIFIRNNVFIAIR
jgi:hypothetical protein